MGEDGLWWVNLARVDMCDEWTSKVQRARRLVNRKSLNAQSALPVLVLRTVMYPGQFWIYIGNIDGYIIIILITIVIIMI